VLRRLLLLLAAASVWGCVAPHSGDSEAGEATAVDSDPSGAVSAREVAEAGASEPQTERPRCHVQIEQIGERAALPGAPRFEKNRADVLARAKAEPVVFLRTPRVTPTTSAAVEHYRQRLKRGKSPAYTLHHIYGELRKVPEVARAVLLREGYLYAESPGLASALEDFVKLHHLFREPELVIQRGATRLRVRRGKRHYEYVTGPEPGERASLLLLDRVWVAGHDPGEALHVAVADLPSRVGADRMRIRRLTADGIVADLRYGSVWVPSVLDVRGNALQLRCESIPDGAESEVAMARNRIQRRERVLKTIRSVIRRQVDEGLPFDEPRTEEGQQDGNLRPEWKRAYARGAFVYEFNEDSYLVFDRQGRPRPPQVCIDFITDTLERASGSWWPSKQQAAVDRIVGRERSVGRLDFERLGIGNRRSVGNFVDFAWNNPQWFDAYDLAPEERIPFQWRERFFAHLYDHRDRFVPGDIVTIYGPRDDGEDHYHSFFVYQADPVSGMPTLLASNAGRPRIRTWEKELRSSPRRSIRSRVRPRLRWLESVVLLGQPAVAGGATDHEAASG
jgi:hypothetical protein